MALECVYRLLLAMMSKRGRGEFTEFARKVAARLFPTGKQKKDHVVSSPEECADIIVDIINLISVYELEFAAQEIILPMLKDKAAAFPEYIFPLVIIYTLLIMLLGIKAHNSSLSCI